MNRSHLRQAVEAPSRRQLSSGAAEELLSTSQEGDEEEYWKEARPTSVVRRYQAVADVRTEVGRARADALPESSVISTQRHNVGRQNGGEIPVAPMRRRASERQASLGSGGTVRERERERERQTDEPLRSPQRADRRYHWLLWLGLFWLVMVVGWVVLSALTGWWQTTLDDWRYGRPRTFQIDAVVGHNDSPSNPSHFIALNLNRHVEIIELPGGDATKARIYVGPVLVGPGQDLAPVTLSFQDVNGDGKLDMIVTIEGSHFFFINQNGSFRPAQPGEPIRYASS
ncbi:MAG: VCBS repeat-containing protein [Thermogemmatispora sp.]|uniref:FG-GAP repeat domain-containing protein n=1 Tax=Thermogemmatispora sp. TaxID=1968838 RepID=UPI001D885367|nr:VCBS repeat-containing protein [Thermogemmatispora sp.]MBX5450543.1 VCBS repeat-containing protein [Thermogemmatispora sp.]